MKNRLNKTYNPEEIEQPIYEHWETQGYFKPNCDKSIPSYTIAIPPPNVTGSLHMGHAFQQTIMDALIRYHRMQGKNTLWQSGMDHAGIATQMVVERKIATEENKMRHDYNRDAFIEKIWQWKAESGGNITRQMRRLGDSVDWDRERFTMDEGLSNAVNEVFVKLYEEGLIYRGKRLVNWDPKLHTAISDLEVENRETNGSMWYLRYPLADGHKTAEGKDYLVVATTRPETLLGDTGVAVNPDDSRYKALIGKEVILPFVHRRIPIIGDAYADIEKGTGCVKITPAHDFNDYEVGRRHQLPMINIFTLDGRVRSVAEIFDTYGQPTGKCNGMLPEAFKNLERSAARTAIIAAAAKAGILEKLESYNTTIPYGDRSGVVIEPMLTDQWYVKTKSLAQPAIDAVKNGDIQFVPKQYENMYFSWMNDIQDWCISRQLWWGHRIPAWYDNEANIYVGRCEDEVREKYNLKPALPLTRDNDVLDTWFSSALWTFSTQGWPEKTEDLAMFHPTNVLVTAFDIIFFWVARMIMMTMHFIKDEQGNPQVPFKTVYVTGLIRDEKGQKMSKSKGNVLDPIDMIDGISLADLIAKRTDNMMQTKLADKVRRRTEKLFPEGICAHGTDALRFTLAALASTGRDINWDMKRLEGYRNFCNKLWNASRYVLMQTEDHYAGFNINKRCLSLADKWIIAEFNRTVKAYRDAIDTYRFDVVVNVLYEFTWNQFCDWYVEFTKPVFASGNIDMRNATCYTLVNVLEALLRLMHPIIPFITEAIWQNIKGFLGITADSIMLQKIPDYDTSLDDNSAIADIDWIKQMITAIRNIRVEINVSPGRPLTLFIRNADEKVIKHIDANKTMIMAFSKLSKIIVLDDGEVAPLVVTKLVEGAELMVPVAGLIDKETELLKLKKEISRLSAEIKRVEAKLCNQSFVAKAPYAIVEKEKEKLTAYQHDKMKLVDQYNTIYKL